MMPRTSPKVWIFEYYPHYSGNTLVATSWMTIAEIAQLVAKAGSSTVEDEEALVGCLRARATGSPTFYFSHEFFGGDEQWKTVISQLQHNRRTAIVVEEGTLGFSRLSPHDAEQAAIYADTVANAGGW
jgi:hypothetical protein